MVAYTGSITIPATNGGLGEDHVVRGEFTFTTEIEDTDTITWSGILGGGDKKIVAFSVFGQELDTNATPTATFTVGTEDDADGLLTTKGGAVGLQNSLAGQLVYKGDGALVDATTDDEDIVLTMTAATATGASSGTIFVEAILRGV